MAVISPEKCARPLSACLSLKDASRLPLYYWVTQPAATITRKIFFKVSSYLGDFILKIFFPSFFSHLPQEIQSILWLI
jgi:hypothetical protein